MKSSTFWESAGRPLFVRSVWLGNEKTARAPQRHFLLDYEAQQKLKQRRQSTACENTSVRHKKERLQHAFSYEQSEPEQSRQYRASCLAVASRKLNLQPPLTAAQTPKPKPKRVGPRRLTKLNLDKLEPHSAHSTRSRFSATPICATPISNCLETPVISKRLAERVLNWLDLAVKGMSTDIAQVDLDSSPSAQRCSTAKASMNKPCAYTRWKKQEKSRQKAKSNINVIKENAQNQTDVKRVSIVFDHARLVKSVSSTQLKKLPMLEKSAYFKQFLETTTKTLNKIEPTTALEKPASVAKRSLNPHEFLHDSRKQLHIFMPSLPDKPNTVELNAPSMIVDFASTVDSTLSFNESEFS